MFRTSPGPASCSSWAFCSASARVRAEPLNFWKKVGTCTGGGAAMTTVSAVVDILNTRLSLCKLPARRARAQAWLGHRCHRMSPESRRSFEKMATAVTCRVAYLLELSTNYEREQKDHDYSDNGKCFGRVEGNSACGWQGLRRLWHEGTCNLPEGAGGPKQLDSSSLSLF